MTSTKEQAPPRTFAAVIEAVGGQPKFHFPTVELQITFHDKKAAVFTAARHRNWPETDWRIAELRDWIEEQRVAAEAHWARVREEAAKPAGVHPQGLQARP